MTSMIPAADWGVWLAFADGACRYVLLNWSIQATLLLGAALAATRLPRVSAASRHGFLSAALYLSAAAPLVLAVPSARPLRLKAPAGTGIPGSPGQIATRGRTVADGGPAWPRPAPAPPGTAAVIALAVLTIACGRLARVAHGSATLRRMTRGAVPADRHRLHAACGYAVADIPVLETDRVTIPSVIGVWEPSILLPRGFCAGLPTPELRHVLLHEEAHVRRRDPLTLLLAGLAHSLLFWHPLALQVRRQMEIAAEDACDERVLARGAAGPEYARTLLRVLEDLPARSALAACRFVEDSGGIRRRVLRILHQGPGASGGMACVAGVAVLASCGGMLMECGSRPSLPRVAPRRAAATGMARGRALPAPWAPSRALGDAHPPRRAFSIRRPAVTIARLAPVPARDYLASVRSDDPSGQGLADAREATPAASRCVVFVLDTSDGMGPYLADARNVILDRVRRLGAGDRFNVLVTTGDEPQFAGETVAPVESSFMGVEAWLSGRAAGGSDGVEGGIARALATANVSTVILLSDSARTEAPASRTELASFVERQNRFGAQVLAITIGPAAATADAQGPSIAATPGPLPGRTAMEGTARKEDLLRP